MNQSSSQQHKRAGIWERLFDGTVGQVIRFLSWSFMAIIISVLIEWIGMVADWWDRHHSREMLISEIQYLNQVGQNAILNFYPKDVATHMLTAVDNTVHEWGLRALSQSFTGVFLPVAYAIEAAINILYVFIVRFAVVLGIIPGLSIIFLLAITDGLSERSIRTYCGGVESSWLYHHAKRLLAPSVIIVSGLYMTLPFSLNPLWFFLPLLFVFWLTAYITASTFKKFL